MSVPKPKPKAEFSVQLRFGNYIRIDFSSDDAYQQMTAKAKPYGRVETYDGKMGHIDLEVSVLFAPEEVAAYLADGGIRLPNEKRG